MIGLIGKKTGMTQLFDSKTDALLPVTIVKVDLNVVVKKCIKEKNGYEAVLLGASDIKKSRIKKPIAGQFPEGIPPKSKLCEFRGFPMTYELGQTIGVNIFEKTDYVDVTGFSKGKGFQGVMRRHGFHGGRKTHGSKFHRGAGSTGMAAYPAKIIKGTKMAGRMGNVRVTVQNLKLINIVPEEGLLIIQGAIPGPTGGTVYIRTACKKGGKNAD